MRKLFLTLGVLIGNDALAQSCMPVPDCAAMGYTETSCEGDFLRCPFDTTKMACVVKKTTGASTGCEVGMIYYSDGTCSSLYNATKSIAGIVVEKDKLILSKPVKMTWASNANTDVSGITNITSSDTAKTDMNGKSNTAAIVSAYSSDTASNNAAKYCNSFTGGINGTEGKWYLPAVGELYTYLYGYYLTLKPVAVDIMGWNNFETFFWSSSEYSSLFAWFMGSDGGSVAWNSKNINDYSVSCLLEI